MAQSNLGVHYFFNSNLIFRVEVRVAQRCYEVAKNIRFEAREFELSPPQFTILEKYFSKIRKIVLIISNSCSFGQISTVFSLKKLRCEEQPICIDDSTI